MTNEEAIERLKEGEPFSEIYNKDWEEAKYLAIKALKKQIPKKPLKDNGDFICPSCSTYYNMLHGYDCCTQCGQRLDWGEDK